MAEAVLSWELFSVLKNLDNDLKNCFWKKKHRNWTLHSE